MNQTPMQKARESFLKKHYIYDSNKEALELLNRAEDLSTLLIKVEAFDSTETGTFAYNPETYEFYLYGQDQFFVRTQRPCSGTGKCYKDKNKEGTPNWDNCLTRHAGEKIHSFGRFLQMCLEPVYEIIDITEKPTE